MKIEHLKYIVEVARLKSISLAAEKLFVSQPTVSQAINSLEIELGRKLFKRSRSGTIPTEYGGEVIEKAKEILYKVNEIKESAENHSNLLTGNLTLMGVPGFYQSLLPEVIISFKEKFPGIDLQIFEGGSLEIEKRVIDETIDIGFVAVNDPEYYKEKEDRISFVQLTSGTIMACVGAKSPLASKKSITLEELINYPIISFKQGYQMYHTMMNSLEKYGKPNLLFTSTTHSAGKQILAEGMGIGFCSSVTIRKDPFFNFGRLVTIPIEAEEFHLYYGYLKLKYQKLSKASKIFIDILRNNIMAENDE